MASVQAVLEELAEAQKASAETTKDMIVIIKDMASRIQTLEQRATEQNARIQALERGKVACN